MRATISHPIPVRWTPPRAKHDRVAFDVALTPVEIPEVPHGRIERSDCSYFLGGGTVPFHVHADRCFERVTAGMLNLRATPADRPASTAEVLAHLASPGQPSIVRRPGTPLCGLRNPHAELGDHGQPLPDSVHAKSCGDNTAAARRALDDFVRDCMVTDGEAFYVARSMPVLHLAYWKSNYILDRHPVTVSEGVGFEPSRFPMLKAVTREMAGWYSRGEVERKMDAAVSNLRSAFGGLPYSDHDLAAFRNDGPDALARHIARAREKGVPDEALRGAAAIEARLRPAADLGRIGSIAPQDHAAVENLVGEGALALQAAMPEGMQILGLRSLAAYVEGVIVPMRLGGGVPAEDIAALDGLSPAP